MDSQRQPNAESWTGFDLVPQTRSGGENNGYGGAGAHHLSELSERVRGAGRWQSERLDATAAVRVTALRSIRCLRAEGDSVDKGAVGCGEEEGAAGRTEFEIAV